MKQKTGDFLRIGILSLIISIGGSYAFAEWTAPTSAPPGGNTPPSVNVGGTTQVKNGNFGLGTGYTFWATRAEFGKATSLSTTDGDSNTTLVTKDYLISKSGPPSGAVVAFDLATCPAGWSDYTSANGRQIIGISATHARGTVGGSETHVLSVAEMPSHNHAYNISINEGGWAGDKPNPNNKAANENSWRDTRAVGGNQAHSVMDPYITLRYCKKN